MPYAESGKSVSTVSDMSLPSTSTSFPDQLDTLRA